MIVIAEAFVKSIKKAPTIGTTKNAFAAYPYLEDTACMFTSALGVAPKPKPINPAAITTAS